MVFDRDLVAASLTRCLVVVVVAGMRLRIAAMVWILFVRAAAAAAAIVAADELSGFKISGFTSFSDRQVRNRRGCDDVPAYS